MKKKILLLVLATTFLNSFAQEISTKVKETLTKNEEIAPTTFYVINSAEKKAPTEAQKDPYLSDEGVERSKNWANTLAYVKFDAIYTVNTISAKQTAQVINEKLKTSIYAFDTNAMYDASFKYLTKGKNILIIGENVTTTKFTNVVLGMEKYALSENKNYNLLHILTDVNDSKTAILLNIGK